MYTIKQTPADFIVKEETDLPLPPTGPYLYIHCKKENRTTIGVVKELAKQLKIKEKEIGYAGIKDKYAVTEQTFSVKHIKKEKIAKVHIDNVTLTPVSYGQKPLSLGDLKGNEFVITVRNLDKTTYHHIEFFVNYFDEQRFSSKNVAIGKHLLKKEFKIALEEINNTQCNKHLEEHAQDYIGALKKIPTRLLKLYIHAYQSYLWNSTVAQYLMRTAKVVAHVPYSLGEFVFVSQEIADLHIPIIGFTTDELQTEGLVNTIIHELMQEEKITFQDFIIKQFPQLSAEGTQRAVFAPIHNLQVGEIEEDDLNLGKKKRTCSFSLPKGSYATMAIRKIMS